MKKFTITENGTFYPPFGDFDRAAIYLVGNLGGGSVELLLFGSVVHTLDPNNPVLVSMGRGADLRLRIAGASSFVDTEVVALEVR